MRLFRPRTTAPEIERFLGWLAATPYPWHLRADGKLRADVDGTEICAVTGVARHREARRYSVGDWVRAGAQLGLSYAAAGLIVDAADGRAAGTPLRILRTRLLIAARVAPTSRPPLVVARPRHILGRDLRPRPSMSSAIAETIVSGNHGYTLCTLSRPLAGRSGPASAAGDDHDDAERSGGA